MLFSKLFRKDPLSYVEKGDRLMTAGRFADARCCYEEAIGRLDAATADGADALASLRQKMATAGNRMAEMNLQEAEYCLVSGDFHKAEEHLELSRGLADDVTIREKTEKIFALLDKAYPPVHGHKGGGSCGGCGSSKHQVDGITDYSGEHLGDADRYELLIRPLPGDLPDRYAEMGEEFAYGYLAAHSGDREKARLTFERLLAGGDNDIILYETAIISHQEGDSRRCETLLRRALALNDTNPLCNLGLVQLLTDGARFDEALPMLEKMVERGILADQAMMFLGEIYRAKGENDKAVDQFTRLLPGPFKREAAERLVMILEEGGRSDEAAYVAKQYLKGCC
ncbi:MAG: hypothetical protein ED859_09530 [Desulfuromonadales bacterium]|nr:MAG: hypothetical protein ED859_09530 [Desulfuromonadales bacterium]